MRSLSFFIFLFLMPQFVFAECNREYHRKLCSFYESEEFQKELEIVRKKAESGDADSQFYLASFYDIGAGVLVDKVKAFNLYKKAAEQNNLDAQYFLANKYFYGEGVKESKTEAFNWYKKAAESGYSSAQLSLGHMYKIDFDDKENAIFWYKKAAESGEEKALEYIKELSE